MGKLTDDFDDYRAKMNEKILASNNKVMKRIKFLENQLAVLKDVA